MKILVTGAAGFIGYYTSKKLLEKGHTVVGLDNINDYYDVNLKYARLGELGIEKKNAVVHNQICISSLFDGRFSFIRLDLADRKNLPQLFDQENFDVVCTFC